MSSVTKVVAVLALGLLAGAAQAEVLAANPAPGKGRERVLPGQVVVQFGEGWDDTRMATALREVGGRELWRSRFSRGLRVVGLPEGMSVEQGVARFAGLPGVEFAEPNYLRKLAATPNDPFFRFQWNLNLINASRTWDIQAGKTSVIVAVVDSGVAHESLAPFTIDLGIFYGGRVPVTVGPFGKAPDWGGTAFTRPYDAIFGSGHAWDDDGHGTHVASTIAEATNNSVGLAGLAYGVTIMPIKACVSLPWYDEELVGCPTASIADGIDYARNNGAKVVNLSLGGSFPSQAERAAVQRAAAADMVLVAATGNDDGPVGYPAAFDDVIAVGAVNGSKQRAFYSNFGPEVDLVAPGGDLEDAGRDGIPDFVFQQTLDFDLAPQGVYTQFIYGGLIGTSMATPHVSAAAALLVSQGITSGKAVRSALEQFADDLGPAGRDNNFGHGLINPAKALAGLGLGQ